MSKKAILTVSFGTTYEETLKKNIGNLENEIAKHFPEYDVCRAFTSSIVMKRLKAKGINVNNVEEALNELVSKGYEEVVLFPTHIMNGFEYEKILSQAEPFADKFTSIKKGHALLSNIEDMQYVAENLVKEYSLAEDEAMMFVGHGTEHNANIVYAAMNYVFRHMGHPEFIVSTVEGFPDFEASFEDLAKLNKKKVRVAPLLLVAGDHATNDIAGDDDDSLKMQLKAKGYEVTPYIKGLGEYPFIVNLYIKHLEETLSK